MATESQKQSALEVNSHADEVYEMQPASKLGGTDHDNHDMRVLGRVQQLNVRRKGNYSIIQDDVYELLTDTDLNSCSETSASFRLSALPAHS
jgi:hypothetical protein